MSLISRLKSSKTTHAVALGTALLASNILMSCSKEKPTSSYEPATDSFQDTQLIFPDSTFTEPSNVRIQEQPLNQNISLPIGTIPATTPFHVYTDSLQRPVKIQYTGEGNPTLLRFNEEYNVWDVMRTEDNTAITSHFSLWDWIFGEPEADIEAPCDRLNQSDIENIHSTFELAQNYTKVRCNAWHNLYSVLNNYVIGTDPFNLWLQAVTPFMQEIGENYFDLYTYSITLNAPTSIISAFYMGKNTTNKILGISEEINESLEHITEVQRRLELQEL